MYFQQVKRGLNDWWRYALVFAFIVLGYILGQTPLAFYINHKMNSGVPQEKIDELASSLDFSVIGSSKNLGFIMLLMFFLFTAIAFLLSTNYFHKRPLISFITPSENFNWKKMGFAAAYWLGFGLILVIVRHFFIGDTSFNFQPLNFIVLLLISVTLLPIQTTTEELICRGWMFQGLGNLFKNRWIPFLIVVIFFAAMHSSNPEVAKYGLFQMQYFYLTAALILGIMTIMDDSLELAIGTHFGFNFISAVLMNYEGSVLQTYALFKAESLQPVIMASIVWLLAIPFFIYCARAYKWPSYKYFFEPIEFTTNDAKA